MYVLNSITHGSDNSGAQRRIRSLTCLTLREDVNQHSAPGILARIRNKAHVRPTRPAFQSLGGKDVDDSARSVLIQCTDDVVMHGHLAVEIWRMWNCASAFSNHM
ncbi:hypothetical protein T4B_2 [Trichinella pseudospiralis]|uniref:Uncharacterized protein n=2 Tax=Trichinella pseudospiralis TaxID=6337 RepID=A0A0V1FXN0_TRIPS|nr:hypothetical protein T4A_11784 [Trichinella pseudospiralis]KRY90820.1 hypothetical protein T4D_11798 [Trichinella pseudospiralis]KRZ31494.1 hypothetical protein T4B_2 [Trichinella pseudospiralis]